MTVMRPKYRKLEVWQEAVAVYSRIYVATQSLPAKDRALVLPLRRTASAVFMNIAESTLVGHEDDSEACLAQARRALHELDIQLRLAVRYGVLQAPVVDEIDDICARLEKRLNALVAVRSISPDNSLQPVCLQQPDPSDLEDSHEHAEQEVYVARGLSAGSSWKRQPALAE